MEEATAKKPKPPKAKKSAVKEIYDWSESIFASLVAVIICLTFLVRGTVVEGDSMLPTLEDAQFLTLSRVYDRLKHNDIVVIYATGIPAGDGTYGKPIIKRVIGLPGDTIRIDTVEGVVYRNSAALPLSELRGTIYEDGHVIADYTRSRFDMPVTDELLVPDNCIFVMGDNRNNSKDSRDRSVGMVDKNYVIGKVLLRVTPFERLGQVT